MRKAVSTLLVSIILLSVITFTTAIDHVEAVDGNESMVTLVKDSNLGSNSSKIANFIVDESTSTLYFPANDGIHGLELWKSDGTASGTMLVKDINPGASDSLPDTLQGALLGQTLFFVANDGIHGSELWKTDGTEAGTAMVKDLWDIDDRGSGPGHFLQHGGMVYFLAYNYSLGNMLWKTDGTPSGTVPIVPTMTDPGYSPVRLVLSQGSFLYFIGDDNTHGRELWRTDGTAMGTIMLKDIVPGANWEIHHEVFVKAFGSLVFTVDYDSLGTSTQLWITDGTSTGTQLLKYFQTASGWHPVVVVNQIAGNLLFFAGDGTNGYELWKTDGTPTGTVIVKDINPGSGDTVDFSVYSYAGTPDYQAKFGVSYSNAAPPYYLHTDASSNLYVVADDGTAGWDPTTGIWTSKEIWKTDGTSAGTVKVTNFGSGGPVGDPYDPTPIGETLYYFRGYDLWKIDTPGETAVLVFNFTIPDEIFSMGGLVVDINRVFGNNLLILRYRPDLATTDPMDGYREIWITDGTNSGTRLLFTTATDWSGLLLEVMNGVLFFVGEARVQDPSERLGSKLYKYPNEAPAASISGSYTGLEGSPILFDASASTDDHSIVSYDWDWNDDGTYDETTATALVEHTWYDDYSGSARLKVVDGYGLVGEASTTVNILNVPPVASIDSIEHLSSSIFVGDSVLFHGSFLDPGADDTHSTTWTFGDGTSASGVLTLTHVYTTNGLFTVTLTVTDDDGGVGSNSTTIKVMTINEAISDLINTVRDLNIPAGLKNSLLRKLRDVNRLLLKGNYVGAMGKLNDFINQVEAQIGKKLDDEQATYLISRAQEIMDHI